MPEDTPQKELESSEEISAELQESGTSLFSRIKLPLVVVLVVTVECVLAYFLLPTASDTAAMAESLVRGEATPVVEEVSAEEKAIDQIEVDLGEFSVTSYQPVSNSTLRIDFHLFSTVASEDQEELTKLLDENEHRFREQVIVTVRSVNITDLADAGLGLIKRRILEKTNRLFEKRILRSVIVSDFSFIEQ